ncbi:MAG: AAA family ATPase, partial [Actinomycetota bacterium]
MNIVARRAELKDVAGLIDETGDGLRALLLEGEAGIGKTTLWRWGLDRARARGDVILSCRPGEAEASLPFAALGDLLEPALDDTLPALTPRQRTALEAAMARIEPAETLGRLAVARAALSVIREVARNAPLVIAIDDAQWLDGSSAEALEFIVRRFEKFAARILITRRREEDPIPLGLDRAVEPEHLTRLWLEPFTVGEIDELLRARIDLTLPRPRLVELRRITGGNPFYALEIGRATDRRSSGDDVELTVPDPLGDLLRGRLHASSPQAQDAVLLAAAISQPAAWLVEAAAGSSDGLAEAVRDGMLELDGDRLLFVHPLLASVAYSSAAPWERRNAHTRLAVASTDPLERARHLALSTEDPDEEVASELDAAA